MRRNGKSSRAKGPRKQNPIPRPPQFNSNVVKHHKFRFLASSAVANVTITNFNVLAALGGVGTVANSTITQFNKSFRIKSIEIWTPPASQGASATCAVEWLAPANSPNWEVSDSSMNPTYPAHILARPPPNSLASFWNAVSTSQNMFEITASGGSIVDLVVDYIEDDQEAANNTTTGVATVVLGNKYYLALDGVTTHLLVPVSLNTTF